MTAKQTIAVVSADEAYRGEMLRMLKFEGFNVWGADSAEAFYRKLVSVQADMVLADLLLPGESGLSLISYLKDTGRFNLVALTEAASMDDQFASFEAGANLVFARSIRWPLLLAGLKALPPVTPPKLPAKAQRPTDIAGESWRLDESRVSLVTPNRVVIPLSDRELRLLRALLTVEGKGVMKAELLAALGFKDGPLAYDRVAVILASLRRKVLAETGLTLPIRSVFGKGLRFVPVGERRG